jgi:hypothetical protein
MTPTDRQRRDRLERVRAREGRGGIRTSRPETPLIHTNLATWPLSPEEREQAQRRAVARAGAEQVEREEGQRRWSRFKDKVRASMRSDAEGVAAEEERVAAMSPAAQAAHYARKNTHTAPLQYPKSPPGWVIAQEEIRAEDARAAAAELEAQEREDGTAKRRQEYDKAQLELVTQRDADLLAERERHRAAEEAIRERAAAELLQMGARP